MQIAAQAAVLDNANMVKTAENSPIYDALMAVKPDDLSLNAWTVKAGVGRSIFTEIRRHGNPTSETLQRLLDAIGISWAQFDAGMQPVRSEVSGTGMGVGDVRRAWAGSEPAPRVPLVGSAVGGEYADIDEHIELTELHLGEVLDYLARPTSLDKDPDAYAVTIVGDSMAPRFEPGERAFVSPRSPVGIGDDVIVQLCAVASNDEADQADARVTMVLIKRLVRRSAGFVELKQFNPDAVFRVPTSRVAAIHRVRGRL